jgi:general L-amino acid transport system substrate-binding protein
MKKSMILILLAILALLIVGCAGSTGQAPAAVETVIVTVEVPAAGPVAGTRTLDTVLARGKLICGGNQAVPGFGYLNEDGSFSGFDIDFCRALAAAIFGDPTKVEIRPLTAAERFTALQTGEIDVLSRNTTWSLQRDTELGTNFVHTTFYDGQGMMVRKDSGITTLEQLDGATICVQAGTTTELNLADVFSSREIAYSNLTFETADDTAGAYEEGRCDGFTTDKSGLVSRRTVMADPSAHVILDETMSKEPLGPVVRHGDDQWFDIVQWTVFAMFVGEEYGVSSANVDSMKATTIIPEVAKLLGNEGEMGTKLGLSNEWAYNIIKLVGNYAEVYNRNLGPETPTYIPRGLNSLYTDGGLLYSPPVR